MIVIGTNLSMVRGDSESITVRVKDHPFQAGDKIEMTVRKKATVTEMIFHKTVTEFEEDGSAVIEIRPEDTEGKPFGKYMYDIQWTSPLGIVKTIVKTSKDNFTIEEEVTY